MSRNKRHNPPLMEPREAIVIANDPSAAELEYCWNLYKAYQKKEESNALHRCSDQQFTFLCMVTFFYCVGKAQGIRDERARRKERFRYGETSDKGACKRMDA